MRKAITLTTLVLISMAVFLITAQPIVSKVGPDALVGCKDIAFSTEEDFVTQGPEPPDGNPIISDGDLLGANCTVCARNQDLLEQFDVSVDLGLDAADVINVDGYIVAFSTELDSPHGDQFTAGDLLITPNSVIPNIALTHLFNVSYDLGLDAVHFTGNLDSILAFLTEARQNSRDDWLAAPSQLATMLAAHNVDIWFSTEGTWAPAAAAGFLDGDLLSARYGTVVAGNDVLLPASVPAGIPNRGVDFGLDAVTTNRDGDRRQLHFSTEILHQGEFSFTDGDVLEFNNGIAATNEDLIGCFEPKARFLGLDALSVNVPGTPECESRITRIAGVDVADIGTDGMAITGTVGVPPIMGPVPFGGWIDIQGSICEDVTQFRVSYRLVGSALDWTPIPILPAQGWTVKDDAFLPPTPDCLGSTNWASDSDGWYDGINYRHLTDPGLGGCNTGLSLTVWDSDDAISGKDKLYEVVLAYGDGTNVYSDTTRLVQLDNSPPEVALDKLPGTCDVYDSGDMPLTVTGRISDTHFYRYRLILLGDSYPSHYYPGVTYYDDPVDNVIDTGTIGWNAYVPLHNIDVHDLDPNPVDCGYTVFFTAWERTLWSTFNWSNNQPYHYPGHRHTSDAWTFKYTP